MHGYHMAIYWQWQIVLNIDDTMQIQFKEIHHLNMIILLIHMDTKTQERK